VCCWFVFKIWLTPQEKKLRAEFETAFNE